jgi:DNA/RNA-binding domain of Phe-tRNA-synthetase-like protein
MRLIVTTEVKALGINACMALIKDASISNKSNPLEKRKKEVIEKLQDFEIAASPILEAYREFYGRVGLEGFVPPAQHLIALAQRNGRLPNINTVVDSYNLVSAESCLSIGAHDTARIKGDISFRLTDGSERYIPLGETEPVTVLPGEYACMDEEKIICRMDVKQCQETRITKETKAFIVYVQGNRATEFDYLLNGLQRVCDLIKEICGGAYEIILPEEELS